MSDRSSRARKAPRPRPPLVLAGLAVLTLLAAYTGFRAFWFLTDDAFIAFRYAQNAVLGRGLVWNPAPFAPVEGYTSFLWVAVLSAIWKVTGLLPPDVCNWLSFACGLGTLALTARLALSVRLPSRHEELRLWLLAAALLGILTNRTFLAWLSSGLETALVNLLLTAWIDCSLREPKGRLVWPSVCAALLALARPDGLLFVAATPLVVSQRAPDAGPRALATSLSPLLVVPAHLLWRRATYGEWLPNTYFAKYVGVWPEAGVRYAAAFVIEYGVWVWAILLSAWILRRRAGSLREFFRRRGALLVVISALAAHLAYYTLLVGGDHFEFRVYSHLIPLLFITAGYFCAWAFKRRAVALLALASFIVVSWPIPWTHYWLSKDLDDRRSTLTMVVPVSDSMPLPLRPPALLWDSLQAWLIPRFIGARHQEHKVFWTQKIATSPTREEGSAFAWEDRPILAAQSVGVLGWVMPNVAIIDMLGLNDRVIARSPIDPNKPRRMAHDRAPPPGYVECFRPNMGWIGNKISMKPRAAPLPDEVIQECERR